MHARLTLLSFAAITLAAHGGAFLAERPGWERLNAKATELARRNMEDLGDGWKPQMTCMPGFGVIWQWDSCFMALYAGYTPKGIDGLGNLDNLYSMQGDDGFIAMAYTYATRKPTWEGRINPPLYAWVEWLYARRTGDLSRLPRAYEVCSKYFKWLKANRTRPSNGLYWFEDTGSSGMDNSPRSGYFAEHLKGSDVCFVDLSCQQVLHARCLAKIAPLVGKAEEAPMWEREAEELSEKINDIMWSDNGEFYYDVYIETNNKLATKSAAAFWALVSGVATAERAAALVRHLEDPRSFCTPNGVASLSVDDPNYSPLGRYWLGGVWPPMQYMVAQGLRANGYRELARVIAERHLDNMLTVFNRRDFGDRTIWECYSPELSHPSTDKVGRWARKDFVGWGGLGPIVMFVEDVIGLDINALDQRVDWYFHYKGRQGVTDLPFNGGTISLEAEVDAMQMQFKIKVTTDRPFRLRAIAPDGTYRVVRDIKPGVTFIDSTKGVNASDTDMEDMDLGAEKVTERIELLKDGDLAKHWYTWTKGERQRDCDSKGVFTAEGNVLKVSGRDMGCVTTRKAYRDYKLTLEYRFVDNDRQLNKTDARDAGILFHSTGEDGAFWDGTWMNSFECNIIQGASGDLIVVGDKEKRPGAYRARGLVDPATKGKECQRWSPEGTVVTVTDWGRIRRPDVNLEWKNSKDEPLSANEKPIGEWNRMELVCRGDKAEFYFNGMKTGEYWDLKPSAGRIQLQSEGFGVEYRDIVLEPLP